MTEIVLASPEATEALGRAIADVLQPGDVIVLSGPLGAGKTSLARGILAGLGFAHEAPSPSFAIVQPYDPPETRLPVLHVDLYRIEEADEMEELGIDDAADAVLIVEWPERAGAGYWPHALSLMLDMDGQGGRSLTATVPKAWKGRWPLP